MALTQCGECGAQVSDRAAACPRCGNPGYVMAPAKSRGTAIVLALFLGGFGMHKFYLNKPGWGLFYLLFCWTFIPAVISLLEAITYIFTSDESFQRTYVGH